MRVAFLVPGPLGTISGGYGYDRRVIAGLRAEGHTVDAIELTGRHPLPDEAAIAAARAAWAALAPDAVPVIDGLGLPAFENVLDPARAVGLIHHPVSLETGLPADERQKLDAIERRMFSTFAQIIVTSEPTRDELTKSFTVPAERVAVVVPGTDPAPRSPGSGGPTCRILSVGTLQPRKGHDVLIRCLAKLYDLDWHLTIAGGGRDTACTDALHALVAALNVGHRVTFAGEVVGDALDVLWQRADLFALATHYEGYGMAIAEALSRGIPAVVTAGGAAGALITPEAGAAIAVGDEVTYAKVLRRLIFDTALRRAAAEAAWRIGQGLPDWHAQAVTFGTLLKASR